jgi:hypothetical protein
MLEEILPKLHLRLLYCQIKKASIKSEIQMWLQANHMQGPSETVN